MTDIVETKPIVKNPERFNIEMKIKFRHQIFEKKI